MSETDQTQNPPESTPKVQEVNTGRSATPTETVKPDSRQVAVEPDVVPQSYVWLADGSVVRCNDEDLPLGNSGTVAPNGHWEKDGKVLQIVGVYPVEITLPKD